MAAEIALMVGLGNRLETLSSVFRVFSMFLLLLLFLFISIAKICNGNLIKNYTLRNTLFCHVRRLEAIDLSITIDVIVSH